MVSSVRDLAGSVMIMSPIVFVVCNVVLVVLCMLNMLGPLGTLMVTMELVASGLGVGTCYARLVLVAYLTWLRLCVTSCCMAAGSVLSMTPRALRPVIFIMSIRV